MNKLNKLLNEFKLKKNFKDLNDLKLKVHKKSRRTIKGKFMNKIKDKLNNECYHFKYIKKRNNEIFDKLNKSKWRKKHNSNNIRYNKLSSSEKFNDSLIEIKDIFSNLNKNEVSEIIDDPMYYFDKYPFLYDRLKNYSYNEIQDLFFKKDIIKKISNKKYKYLCKKKVKTIKNYTLNLINIKMKIRKDYEKNKKELIKTNSFNRTLKKDNIFNKVRINRSNRIKKNLYKIKKFEEITKKNIKDLNKKKEISIEMKKIIFNIKEKLKII